MNNKRIIDRSAAEAECLSYSHTVGPDLELKHTVKTMLSDSYSDRLRGEYCQLIIRIHKLKNVLNRYDSGSLDFEPSCPVSLLDDQLKVMIRYAQILEYRAAIEGVNLLDLESMRRDWDAWTERCAASEKNVRG